MTEKKPSLAKVSTDDLLKITAQLGAEIVQLRREASAALESGHWSSATAIAQDLREKLDTQERYLRVLERRAKRKITPREPRPK